jgi:hypothetical protein
MKTCKLAKIAFKLSVSDPVGVESHNVHSKMTSAWSNFGLGQVEDLNGNVKFSSANLGNKFSTERKTEEKVFSMTSHQKEKKQTTTLLYKIKQ